MAHAVTLQSAPRASTAPARPASSLRRLWNALERVGQLRAARQLEALARSVESARPELARQLRDAARFALHG